MDGPSVIGFKLFTMKSTLVLAALLLTGFISQAQFLKIGVKVGANLSKISGKSFKDEFGLGYWAGGFAEIKLAKNWYLDPEVQFSETTTRHSADFKNIYQNLANLDTLTHIKLHYLNLPILVGYQLSNLFSLQGGAQFGLLIDKNKNLLQNGKTAFTDGDVALLAGINFHVKKLRISARYGWGIKSINDIDSKDNWTTQTAQLGVGFVL